MDPATYLSQGKFHNSIICKRTKDRVSFALIGDWSKQHHFYYPRSNTPTLETDLRPIVLYVLPSGCSRYVGVLLDGIASIHHLRIVAIDRPGAGGTSSCLGVDRISISTKHTSSVIDSLGYGKSCGKINIFTHSAGWFYALDLLTEREDLFDNTTKIVFSSPFIPTLFSGNMVLSILPKSVVQLLPSASNFFQFCGSSITWSAGVGQDLGLLGINKVKVVQESSLAQKKMKDERIRRQSQARLTNARFHPPYEPHISLGLEAWKTENTFDAALHPRTCRKLKDGESLRFEYFMLEQGVKACTEDFLLCLGKVQGMDNVELERWTEEKLKQVAKKFKEDPSRILIIWCENDFMTPKKGRAYMDTLMRRVNLTTEKWIMADGGHDDGIASKQVMDDVFNYLNNQLAG